MAYILDHGFSPSSPSARHVARHSAPMDYPDAAGTGSFLDHENVIGIHSLSPPKRAGAGRLSAPTHRWCRGDASDCSRAGTTLVEGRHPLLLRQVRRASLI